MTKIITLMLLACALGAAAHAQESERIRGFSIVLLLGEQTGSMMPPKGLSPSAQRAMADIKEFLPYKAYRVLDTQWIAGSEYGTSKGRIRGLDPKDYECELSTQPSESGKIASPSRRPSTRAYFNLRIPGTSFSTTNGARWGDVMVLDNSFAITP